MKITIKKKMVKNWIINLWELFCVFLVFGSIYFMLESCWKGHLTNWRMFILAGIIGVLIGSINFFFSYETPILLQCFCGMLLALLAECIFGYHWNIEQSLGLWNYSTPPLSYLSAVAGQINLVFAAIWFFLSGLCIVIDDAIYFYIFHKGERPYYKIGKKTYRL